MAAVGAVDSPCCLWQSGVYVVVSTIEIKLWVCHMCTSAAGGYQWLPGDKAGLLISGRVGRLWEREQHASTYEIYPQWGSQYI